MKKVKFKDGNYGVRCGWFFGWYFKSARGYKWKYGTSEFMQYCFMSEAMADSLLQDKKPQYELI